MTEYQKLYEAAAAVANAILLGAGGCIKGTLMEDELRAALGLKPGEVVPIPLWLSAARADGVTP